MLHQVDIDNLHTWRQTAPHRKKWKSVRHETKLDRMASVRHDLTNFPNLDRYPLKCGRGGFLGRRG